MSERRVLLAALIQDPRDARAARQRAIDARQAHTATKIQTDPTRFILCSTAPTLSNNIIQKGLAFGRDWSGSVVNSGR